MGFNFDIVGLLLLSKLKFLNINLGLYRDDGLGVCCMSSRQAEKLGQEISRIFNSYNLKITTNINHKIVDFLDVSFDLDSGVFKPFMKENNKILYVNKESNHPPAVTKNLPAGVNKRLSNISASEQIFKDPFPPIRRP